MMDVRTVEGLTVLGMTFGVVLMSLAWLFAARQNFYSLVDVAWAYGIGLIGVLYGILASGSFHRRVLVSVLIASWSLRLGTHLATRLWRKYPEEDRRYAMIKQAWGDRLKQKFFWFFQVQAASQPLLCLPLAFAVQKESSLSMTDFIALFVLLVGIVGESIADKQLTNFKATGSAGVCEVGLWKYSRHPNYFFEWIVWCGFSLFGLTHGWGWLSLVSPIVMFLLLNYVTGIPPAEQQSIMSKGDLYRSYQRRTSRFFPLRRST